MRLITPSEGDEADALDEGSQPAAGHAGGSSRLRRQLERLAVETFSVVLGIILALAANAWHDRRAHDAQAIEALESIRGEVAANRASLREALPYHRAMLDSLVALIARTHGPRVPGGQRAIANWSGIHPPRLLEDAWQTARSTDALQYLPYDVVLAASRTYAVQQRIAEVNRAFFGAVYTPEFASGGVSALGAMSSYLEDMSATEDHLASQYDAELRQLDSVIAGRRR